MNLYRKVSLSNKNEVNDWEAVGCFNNFDHSALPMHFYSPPDLDVNELWPNLKPLAAACSGEAELKNFSCFGIQYHQECWGGVNASLTYNMSGKSRNCKVGVDGYGVGKLYTSFVYKLKSVDGNWSVWSEWTSCSKTCGEGSHMRRRDCTNPAPVNGGEPCKGVALETMQCSLKLCPVNGNWSPWSTWDLCSKSCDEGLQKRERNCTHPAPANGGKPCEGVAMETKSCSLKLCPVDGQWGSWNAWSACSVSCKGGIKGRRRSCNNPSTAHGGRNCTGVSMVTRSCNVMPCPVNGGWSSWNNWSTCQKTCGGGTQFRYRWCNSPPVQHNGKSCIGQRMMSQSCNTHSCPPGHLQQTVTGVKSRAVGWKKEDDRLQLKRTSTRSQA